MVDGGLYLMAAVAPRWNSDIRGSARLLDVAADGDGGGGGGRRYRHLTEP
jgi:hypothetical protein